MLPENRLQLIANDAQFNDLIEVFCTSLNSTASIRVYQQTFRAWRVWCVQTGIGLFDMTPVNVQTFLASQDTTRATRQRQLSALRSLAKYAYVLSGDDAAQRLYELLKITKVPKQETPHNERSKHALSPSQMHQMLNHQPHAVTAPAVRNHALIATLAMTGMRRAEVCALQWQDIDLEAGIIHVAHGKGDQARDVAIVGRVAISALENWRAVQTALGGKRDYVFCGLRKGNKLRADKPMNERAVNQVIEATAESTGVDMTPHTFRRTWLTEYLTTGGNVRDAQEQAGHSRGETTLRYAQPVNAQERRNKARFRFGDMD